MKKTITKMMKQRFLYLLFLLTLLHYSAAQKDDRICTSITVRSPKDLLQLQNCTIVAGHIRLVLTQFSPKDVTDIKSLDVEEITDYLLIYRVNGLNTLEKIFPKLLLIRGAQLLYDQHSLAILENRDLEDIGLISLLRVIRGSVRIESNPSLCFANTINWVSILGQTNKEYHYILKNNKLSNHCPLCQNVTIENINRQQHCWKIGKIQKLPLENYSDECPIECSSKRCNKKGKCCSGNCLTTCSDDNCQYCTNLIMEKKCVDNCLPPLAKAFNRQCVANCKRYGLVRLGTECIDKCPKLYREENQNNVETICTPECTGNFTIKSSRELKGFSDCTKLKGSLTLELTDLSNTKISDLYNELSYLREITGYLKVIKSPQLISLSFFRNLHTIGGSFLIDDIYALYVADNHHLQDIWNENQKVSILKGRIFFHLNPNLCFKKIVNITDQLKESNITIIDVSRNSNGERTICDSLFPPLNVTVDIVNAHEARIIINYRTSEELPALLGYTFYYKEAPNRNISQLDGRHACGNDDWYAESSLGKQRRHVLRNLKPATQYAYFVKTFVIKDYHYDYDAKSDIQYFRTAPGKPGPVQKIFYKTVTSTEIELHWWPPLHPNGILEKYLLRYQNVTGNHTLDPFCSGQQCKRDICVCPDLEPETSGPPPVDTDYYSRELMVYEESLLNFIYVRAKEKRNAPTAASEAETARGNLILQRFHAEAENNAKREQDVKKEDYDIVPVMPVCTVKNPSVVFKKDNQCVDAEEFESDYEIAGNTHFLPSRI